MAAIASPISVREHAVGVYMFPIKSCHSATVDGEAPTRLAVGERGFRVGKVLDRGMVIYTPEDDFHVTQRGWEKDSKARNKTVDICLIN